MKKIFISLFLAGIVIANYAMDNTEIKKIIPESVLDDRPINKVYLAGVLNNTNFPARILINNDDNTKEICTVKPGRETVQIYEIPMQVSRYSPGTKSTLLKALLKIENAAHPEQWLAVWLTKDFTIHRGFMDSRLFRKNPYGTTPPIFESFTPHDAASTNVDIIVNGFDLDKIQVKTKTN